MIIISIIKAHKEHAISDDDNTENELKYSDVLPELSDDSDKEDDTSAVVDAVSANKDVDDPDERENDNK